MKKVKERSVSPSPAQRGESLVSVTYRLPAALLARLDQAKWQEKRSKNQIVISALEEYFS